MTPADRAMGELRNLARNFPHEGRRLLILRPVAAVEGTVLDGFGQMGDGQVLGALEIRDGAGHFEDAVMGARGEALLLHGALKQAFGVGAEFAMGTNLARGHLRVGINFLAGFSEALPLVFAGGHHAVANLG